MRYAAGAVLMLLTAGRPAGAQQCADVNAGDGYPVSAVLVAGDAVDGEYLSAFVSVAAYRWRVPSARRNAYRGWERVRERLLPPEPRWADDWQPEARHTASMLVTVYRDGDVRAADPEPRSGDGRFDRSLESIVDEPMPGSPDWPTYPPGTSADSIVVRLVFGEVAGGAMIRFAADQTPVRLVPGSLRVDNPGGSRRAPSATVKYDVTTSGIVDPASIEVLRSSNSALSRAIEDGLLRARFTPATSNCRAIAQTVVQTFGR